MKLILFLINVFSNKGRWCWHNCSTGKLMFLDETQCGATSCVCSIAAFCCCRWFLLTLLPLSPPPSSFQASLTFCLLAFSSLFLSPQLPFNPAFLFSSLISFAPSLFLLPPSSSTSPPFFLPLFLFFCLPPTAVSLCWIEEQSAGCKKLVNLLPG